jgi:hypothetical protein
MANIHKSRVSERAAKIVLFSLISFFIFLGSAKAASQAFGKGMITFLIPPSEDAGIPLKQWVDADSKNVTHVEWNLTVWVYNNDSSTYNNVQITPDTKFGSSYNISSLGSDKENTTVLTYTSTRPTSDNWLNIIGARFTGGSDGSNNLEGYSNSLVVVNPRREDNIYYDTNTNEIVWCRNDNCITFGGRILSRLR